MESKNFWLEDFGDMVAKINDFAEANFDTTVNVNFVRVQPDGVDIR